MNDNQLKLSVNIFAALTAIILTAVYKLLRIGFDDSAGNSIVNLLNVLGVSLFILLVADNFNRLMRRINISVKKSWITSDAFVTLCGFSIVVFSGLILPFTGINILPLFVCFGVIFLGFSLFAYARQTKFRKFLVAALIGLPFIVWLGGMLFSDPLNPLFFENLFIAQVNKDTVFHVLMSAMNQTYNIPSTGLNGIPFVPYHIGSHWILAQLSSLLKIQPMTTYQMAIPIIIAPLYIQSFLLLGINIRKYFISHEEDLSSRSNLLFWILFFVSQIGFLPYPILGATTPGWQHIATASYVVSLLLSYLCISICLAAWHEYTKDKIISSKFGLLFFLLPAIIGIIAITKIAIGVLMYSLCGYVFFRLKLFKQISIILSFILTTVIVFTIYAVFFSGLFSPTFYSMTFAPFDLYKKLSSALPLKWFTYLAFPLFHYSLAIIFIVLRFRKAGVNNIKAVKEKILQKSLIDVEVIIFLCVIGTLPGLILGLPQISAFWFSDFQVAISTILLLAYLPVFLPSGIFDRPFSFKSIFRGKMARCLVSLALFLTIISVFYNVTRAFIYGLGFNVRNRSYMIIETNKHVNPIDSLITSVKTMDITKAIRTISLLYSSAPQNALKQSNEYGLLQALLKLSKLPIAEKKKSLVFIPQKDSLYWDFLSRHPVYHRISAFVVGIVSGIGMIDGMPPAGSLKDWRSMTGYASYKLRETLQTKEDCKIENLCKKVREKGFSKLILINSTSGSIRVVDCMSERNNDSTHMSKRELEKFND